MTPHPRRPTSEPEPPTRRPGERTARGARFRSAPNALLGCLLFCLCLCLCLGLTPIALRAGEAKRSPTPATDLDPLRVGIAYTSFGPISRSDASATFKAWANTLLREHKITASVKVELLEKTAELRDAISRNAIEAAYVSTEQFHELDPKVDSVFLSIGSQGFSEQYVVVARRDANVRGLDDLAGQRLVRHTSPRTGPAMPWLETSLADRRLPRAETFFREITELENPSKAVLQVFFRRMDACLMTTNAFAIACELNTQLRRQLEPVAVSDAFVPMVFFVRGNYDSPHRAELETTLRELHTTTFGQQVLTVFQGSRVEAHPVACLEPTRALLEKYHRLDRASRTPRDHEPPSVEKHAASRTRTP